MKPKAPAAGNAPARQALAPHNLPYQMFLLVQQMTKRFQQVLAPHGLTPLHWGILCCLWAEDGLRTTGIAKRLEQLGGTVTVGLDGMERDGLVRRKKDRADGRISRIFLTPRGRSLQAALAPAAAALIDDMFVALSPSQFDELARHVANLRQSVSQPAKAPKT